MSELSIFRLIKWYITKQELRPLLPLDLYILYFDPLLGRWNNKRFKKKMGGGNMSMVAKIPLKKNKKGGNYFLSPGKISNCTVSREFSMWPRHVWPLNCPERSEGQFRGQTCRDHVEISRGSAQLDIFPPKKR